MESKYNLFIHRARPCLVPKIFWFSGLWGCLGLLCSTFFSSALRFFSQTVSAPRTEFKKKGGVVRAPKGVLHKLQFFVELSMVEFVEQSQTPPIALSFLLDKHCPIME